jgi:hypothetical protein
MIEHCLPSVERICGSCGGCQIRQADTSLGQRPELFRVRSCFHNFNNSNTISHLARLITWNKIAECSLLLAGSLTALYSTL